MLAPPVTFDDDAHVHPSPAGGCHRQGCRRWMRQGSVVFAGEADDYLMHVRIDSPGFRHRLAPAGRYGRVRRTTRSDRGQVERRRGRAAPCLDSAIAAPARNAARGRCRMREGFESELVGVREPALLSAHRPVRRHLARCCGCLPSRCRLRAPMPRIVSTGSRDPPRRWSARATGPKVDSRSLSERPPDVRMSLRAISSA